MTFKIIMFFAWLILGTVTLYQPRVGKFSYFCVWILLLVYLLADIVNLV